jgi:hypothetical protein
LWRVEHVLADLRSDRLQAVRKIGKPETSYRKITFRKHDLDRDQHLDAVLAGPGHPLYAAVDERLNEMLSNVAGAVGVYVDGAADHPYRLHFFDLAIRGQSTKGEPHALYGELIAVRESLDEPASSPERFAVVPADLLLDLPNHPSPASLLEQPDPSEAADFLKGGYQTEVRTRCLDERRRFVEVCRDYLTRSFTARINAAQDRVMSLAACLRAAHKAAKSRALLGPGDVPMHDAEVRQAFFKEVGQQSDFQAVLEHDFIGANARARRIDERRVKETPSETGRNAAVRLATAILMYSFGGLRRDGGGESEFLPPGITEAELLAACVGPDLDSTTALACLKELREQCLYLHFDGARYAFKKDPNITLLVEQEADAIARDEKLVRDRIKEMLEERLAGHPSATVWSEKPGDIPDKQPLFQIGYLPLEFAGKPRGEQEATARNLFERREGEKPRLFKNGIGLAIPSADQVEGLRRSARYIIAAGRVGDKAKQHNLSQDQKNQLRERTNTEAGAAEAALLRLYAEVWLPKVEQGDVAIEKIAVGGKPLQVTLSQKKQAAIHERLEELITTVQPRVFRTLHPNKIVELFTLGTAPGQTPGRSVPEIVEGFFSFPNFTRLADSAVVRKSVARGVKEKFFGYVAGAAPALGADGRYQVAAKNVRFGSDIAEDEIDLDGGFVMIPEAIPESSPVPVPGTPESPQPPTPGAAPAGGGFQEPLPPLGGTPAPPDPSTVQFSFEADRNKLYAAWQALANLADLCGKLTVSVKGEAPQNLDKSKLENGVYEPLREADLL